MLSRFSEVLQSAADVLAPPASRLEDFEYHWKLIQNFYQNHDESSKVHVEDTKIPMHLHQMLQLLVDEEKEQCGDSTVGPCLEKLINRELRLLDALTVVAGADQPPGARALALAWCTALLRRVQQPFINHASVYQPIQRILIQCNENVASPTEKEEVELLLTLCGLVRKQPGLANIFTTPFVEEKVNLLSIPEDILQLIPIKSKKATPKKNSLFEVDLPTNPIKNVAIVSQSSQARDKEVNGADSASSVGDDNASCKSQKTVYDDNDKFLLIDLLLSYLSSADNHIVLRACEGIMIVSSLPDDDIANLVTSCSSVCENLIEKLVAKFKSIPANVDPCDVDNLNITWGYVAQDFGDKALNKFHGYRELTSFFSWLDYCDTLMKECHPCIATHLARTFRQGYLEATAEVGLVDLHHTVLVTAIVSKCLKVIDSPEFINEISNWLVGDGEIPEWPLLRSLINNCLTDQHELTLETLRFFETIIEKPTEHSLQRLVLCRLTSRSYYLPIAQPVLTDDQDERDRLNDVSLQQERDSNRQAMKQLLHEDSVSGQITDLLSQEGLAGRDTSSDNIHKVINSFLLLLPRAILSDPVGADYEQYIHDAHRHYQAWLDITSGFRWQSEFNWVDNTASSTHSYDSRPEADLHSYTIEMPTKDNDVFHHVDYQRSRLASAIIEEKRRKSITKPSRMVESPFSTLGTTSQCCTIDDLENPDKIGKCGKPASQCPFSQHLILRTRDLTLSSSTDEDDIFDEGPFLRMLFRLLANMPNQLYQTNLQLISILSKLALLPHPNLHEYLLNPMLPTARKTKTLFKVLQDLARKLTMEIPRVKNYKKIIEDTRLLLLSDDVGFSDSSEHKQLFESLIVVEEFCKELAAIAFVKYQQGMR